MITINGNYSNKILSGLHTSRSKGAALSDRRSEKHCCNKQRHCNICKQPFTPQFKYQLFCGKCRMEDDSFMFHEWLPRVPESVSAAAGY